MPFHPIFFCIFSDICILCQKPLHSAIVQPVKTEKGLKGLQAASRKREDEFFDFFFVGQKLHKRCREEYRNDKCIQRDLNEKNKTGDKESSDSPLKLRSKHRPFSFQMDCLLCGQPISEKEESYSIRSFACEDTLLERCRKRGDKWGQTVRSRIESVNDLHSADARYHQQCSVNFRTDRDIPVKRKLTITSEEVPAKTKGKPADEERWEAFLQVATYIQENDDEQITLSDLRQKM
jgi:hypothetical protein